MNPDLRLVLALAGLLVLATGVLTAAGVRVRRAVVVAALRAAVQLAVIGLLLRGVLAAPWAVALALLVMLTTASTTAAGRLRELSGAGWAVLFASVAGAVPTLAVVFAAGALQLGSRYVIALGGIVLGGTMTACIIAGRHLLAGIRAHRDEIEGWLAIGATPRQSVRSVARTAVGEALLPAIDQTRTVGLVTLPGAFVGALFGGASPLDAARFQLIVLVSLLTAQSVAAAALTWQLGAPRTLPAVVAPPAGGAGRSAVAAVLAGVRRRWRA